MTQVSFIDVDEIDSLLLFLEGKKETFSSNSQ